PEPIYSIRSWEERAVEAWIPIEATYADANGDGIVNQNDLLPIGLNYGESRTGTKQRSVTVLSSVNVQSLNAGEEVEMYLETNEEILLTGLSFRIGINGIPESDWQLQSIEVGSWGEVWSDENRMIEFIREQDSGFSAAIAHRGFTQPKSGKSLIKLTVRAVSDWMVSPEVVLERASVVSGREVYTTEDIFLSLDDSDSVVDPGPTLPDRTELLANYPNPFNPATTIKYRLSSDSNVKIDVFNSLGRKVATVLDQQQQAGEYDITFNADNFSSGIYFYRLQTSDYVRTRSMVLIK
ncbi:MAG: T9SS type A sorting domain-containing protein, partial [Bacteroidota bacterium]